MRRVLLLILLLSTMSCSSIADMFDEKDGQRVLGGIRHDVHLVGDHFDGPEGEVAIGRAWGVLDFPFSLMMDSMLLPITLLIAIIR